MGNREWGIERLGELTFRHCFSQEANVSPARLFAFRC
jgi:hypothetical protein